MSCQLNKNAWSAPVGKLKNIGDYFYSLLIDEMKIGLEMVSSLIWAISIRKWKTNFTAPHFFYVNLILFFFSVHFGYLFQNW